MRGGAFHEHDIVRTGRLVERVGDIHDAALDRELAAEWLEAGIAEIGVLNSGRAAAGQEADRDPAGACGPAKAVRGAAEIVDQGVVPIPEEFAEYADARAPDVDAVIEFLRDVAAVLG